MQSSVHVVTMLTVRNIVKAVNFVNVKFRKSCYTSNAYKL